MLTVLVTVKKSLTIFLKSISIYITLYHIISMVCNHALECTIFERLHNCENGNFVIFHNDVINAVFTLRNNKSDVSEFYLCDHFLHVSHRFYVNLFTFLSHFYSPDPIIMGTMILIPSNKACYETRHVMKQETL